MNAPLSLADELAQHVEAFGGTEEEAAAVVLARRARRAELAQTSDPAVLLPAIRDTLSLSAKIDRITKTMSPAQFTLHTDRGSVVLGTARHWATRPGEFSAAFLDIDEMPTIPKGSARSALCTMIARAAEALDVGAEATDAGWTRSVLSEYLAARPPVDSLTEAATSEYPFVDDRGRVCVFGRRLARWIWLEYQEKLTAVEFGKRLRSVGCEPYPQNVGNPDGKRSTRSCWRLPRDLSEPPIQATT